MANILVVDDDPDIGTMLKMMLEFKGYGVMLLNSAEKACDVLDKNPINLVILDMLIAGDNGTDVCMAIRNNKESAQVPVMMISALPDARKTCLDAGANEFISKPFEMDAFAKRVRQMLENGHSEPGAG